MESLDDALHDLREQYVRESLPRLDQIVGLLDVLAARPDDSAALQDLLRHFHAFAGSGSTYRFPRVTALGLEGERACGALRSGAAPRLPTFARLREIEVDLRRTFANVEPLDPPAPSAPPPRPAGRTQDVLVVEDDKAVRAVLDRLLEQEGLRVRAVDTRAAGFSEIDGRLPDALIVDILLPDGSGYDVVRHLRGVPGGEAPAALVVSRLSGFLDKVEAMQCGADAFFEKPVDWQALLRRLDHLLSRNAVEPGRVLAVEDDPLQAAFARTVLETAGYQVRVCPDPVRFEADLAAFRPDLVLMDILLPALNGYDLVRYLRQDERYATLPVVFLTTEGQVESRIDAVKAGGDELLLKPVLPGLLLSTVAARVERARFVRGLLERDGLTGLLTHTALLERAATMVARARRHPERPAAWVMLDLDKFKSINDRFGHPVGDRVLVSLAALLRRRLRQSDALGRYGGEEFAVLLEGLERPDAERLVNRLLDEFTSLVHHGPDGESFDASFSAGVSMLGGAMSVDEWRGAADQALYAAKAAGRRRVVVS